MRSTGLFSLDYYWRKLWSRFFAIIVTALWLHFKIAAFCWRIKCQEEACLPAYVLFVWLLYPCFQHWSFHTRCLTQHAHEQQSYSFLRITNSQIVQCLSFKVYLKAYKFKHRIEGYRPVMNIFCCFLRQTCWYKYRSTCINTI